jgi:hypothetical protein
MSMSQVTYRIIPKTSLYLDKPRLKFKYSPYQIPYLVCMSQFQILITATKSVTELSN